MSIDRHPRTLQEAFGPYTDQHVYDTTDAPAWHDWAWAAVGILAAVACGVIVALGSRP